MLTVPGWLPQNVLLLLPVRRALSCRSALLGTDDSMKNRGESCAYTRRHKHGVVCRKNHASSCLRDRPVCIPV